MLAGVKRVDGDLGVFLVRRADVYHFDGRILQKLFIIGINLGVGRSELFLCFLRLFGDNIAKSDHTDVFDFLERGHVLAVGNTAAADDADIHNSFHDDSSLMLYRQSQNVRICRNISKYERKIRTFSFFIIAFRQKVCYNNSIGKYRKSILLHFVFSEEEK